MRNFLQPGANIDIPSAAYAVDSGEYLLQGAFLGGVANADAAQSAPVVISTEGCFRIRKNAASVFTIGQSVFFNTVDKSAHSNLDADSNSGGTVRIGIAIAAAGAGALTVDVKLLPVTLA